MRAARLSPAELAGAAPAELAGAVLLGPVRLPTGTLPKGRSLDIGAAATLIEAVRAGSLAGAVRLAWPGPEDVHEDDAATRLALAVGGAGVDLRPPRQSRLDLVARWDGVLHVRTEPLRRLSAIDPLEVFTRFHGQAVRAGDVVCSVKVAPHLVPGATLSSGLEVARAQGPLVEVRPYRTLDVAAIAVGTICPDALRRFQSAARTKVEALGSTFGRVIVLPDDEPDRARAGIQEALEALVFGDRLEVLLVGGVSAGDPLSPFYEALDRLGGSVVRRGVPAHPGSMIWLARLAGAQILGVPQCGMFGMATAADLLLPRLLTGETLTAETFGDLAHGGLLGPEMRFRFPAYAAGLESPEEEQRER